MMIKTKKLVSILMTATLLFTSTVPVLANTNEEHSRSNLKIITGDIGDQYLVYTYEENGEKFKVIDEADETFENVNSTIFILKEDGNYEEYETQKVETDEDGKLTVEVQKYDGSIEVKTLSSTYSQPIVTRASDNGTGEWLSYTRTGNTYIKNLTITGIIAALGAASNAYLGPYASSALTAVASTLFGINATYAYFYEIQNIMFSEHSVFAIIREAIYTEYYSDSARTNKIGTTYDEYDGRY